MGRDGIARRLWHRRDGREVKDAVDALHRAPARFESRDVAANEANAVAHSTEVLPLAGREIVQHGDFRALLDESFDDVGADESGAAGHEIAHADRSSRNRATTVGLVFASCPVGIVWRVNDSKRTIQSAKPSLAHSAHAGATAASTTPAQGARCAARARASRACLDGVSREYLPQSDRGGAARARARATRHRGAIGGIRWVQSPRAGRSCGGGATPYGESRGASLAAPHRRAGAFG